MSRWVHFCHGPSPGRGTTRAHAAPPLAQTRVKEATEATKIAAEVRARLETTPMGRGGDAARGRGRCCARRARRCAA